MTGLTRSHHTTRVGQCSSRTLILGLGNELFGDDGVGCVVARRVHAALPPGSADLLAGPVSGYDLLHCIAGYERVVLIDALHDPAGTPGELRRIEPTQLPRRADSPSHGVDLPTVLAAGRQMNAELPRDLIVLGVVARDVHVLREGLGPELRDRMEELCEDILRLVR